MKKEMVVLLVLIFILSGCAVENPEQIDDGKPKPTGQIKDVDFIETIEKESIAFNAVNLLDSAAECTVYFTENEKLEILGLGIFQPKEEIYIESPLTFIQGESIFELELKCENIINLDQCISREETDAQYFCLAFLNKDTEHCEKLYKNDEIQKCKAFILNQPELCEQIKEKQDKDLCYLEIGMNKQNKEACEKIEDESKKITCTAVATNDPDKCLEGDEKSKLVCIKNLAEFTFDISLCDKLEDKDKNECHEELGSIIENNKILKPE